MAIVLTNISPGAGGPLAARTDEWLWELLPNGSYLTPVRRATGTIGASVWLRPAVALAPNIWRRLSPTSTRVSTWHLSTYQFEGA